ncbi:BRISC and BRCA1-A complex member 1-like [Vanessa tameamea]|uniref:BRISC and BRCA1-A complex member 1-like n=1 Tax=Vanessa tameamea TaxID=334116 RepID=A0A8B8IL39_VANTA|nr:BRISC and BRCA1-A complex member 1-like [Vanessa tameamea]
MESPEKLPPVPQEIIEQETANPKKALDNEYAELQEQMIANLQKPNLPNVNVPEKIIICLDVCYDDPSSLFRLGDGTTYTPINMLKRVLDFFIHSKHAINKRTEFALVVLKDTVPYFVQNFTNNLKDILSAIDYVNAEESKSESFDFQKLFEILKQEIEIPEYKQSDCIIPPPYVVRMIVLFARSNCIPVISQEDPYFNFLKKQLYFYIDILLAHEEDCALYKCAEVYDSLQDLDNGYSYVFEISKNATKIHDCIAKLLAHPLQRPLQKNTDYTFSSKT